MLAREGACKGIRHPCNGTESEKEREDEHSLHELEPKKECFAGQASGAFAFASRAAASSFLYASFGDRF
ncbi:MAG: hypothetical protein AMXMBFR16_09050 [Candidatus Uhrbacteria bacterium]